MLQTYVLWVPHLGKEWLGRVASKPEQTLTIQHWESSAPLSYLCSPVLQVCLRSHAFLSNPWFVWAKQRATRITCALCTTSCTHGSHLQHIECRVVPCHQWNHKNTASNGNSYHSHMSHNQSSKSRKFSTTLSTVPHEQLAFYFENSGAWRPLCASVITSYVHLILDPTKQENRTGTLLFLPGLAACT